MFTLTTWVFFPHILIQQCSLKKNTYGFVYCVHYVSFGFQSAVAYRCWVYINELQLKYNISQKISDILLFSDWGKQLAEVGFPQRGNICRDCPQLDTSNYLYFLTKTVTGQAECWWKMGSKHQRKNNQLLLFLPGFETVTSSTPSPPPTPHTSVAITSQHHAFWTTEAQHHN